MTWGKAEPAPLKRWEVKTSDGGIYHVDAHFAFNNAHEGLVFRRYREDNPEKTTTVTASFSAGFWTFYRELFVHE